MSKKRLPAFTLIRRSLAPDRQKRAKEVVLDGLRHRSNNLATKLSNIDKKFADAFVSSVLPRTLVSDSTRFDEASAQRAERVVNDVTRQEKVSRVGILDVGAWVSALPRLLERINTVQSQFTFFEIQAPLPGGLIKKGEWYADVKGFDLSARERKELGTNIFANEFFKAGNNIRLHLGLDYLIGITPAMVAGVETNEIYWNHFSSSDGPVLLISTADLRTFAAKAGRSFESLLAFLMVGQLLAEMNPKVRFHTDRGCLFDYNQDRVSIANDAAKPSIEPACFERIEPENRESAKKLLQLLQRL